MLILTKVDDIFNWSPSTNLVQQFGILALLLSYTLNIWRQLEAICNIVYSNWLRLNFFITLSKKISFQVKKFIIFWNFITLKKANTVVIFISAWLERSEPSEPADFTKNSTWVSFNVYPDDMHHTCMLGSRPNTIGIWGYILFYFNKLINCIFIFHLL